MGSDRRSRRAARWIGALFQALAFCALAEAESVPDDYFAGVVLEEEYFRLISEAGFDTVRVPIRWSSHALNAPPYTVDETFFERVDWVIQNAFERDLNVVINMHHYQEIFQRPSEHTERFIAIWRQIASRYRYLPDNLYLEPLNEPHDRLTPSRWNDLLAETIQTIREVDGVHIQEALGLSSVVLLNDLVLATGGVYVGGGIPPRILSVLEGGQFWEAFWRKGQDSDLLRDIPVHVILNAQAALLGAAAYGLELPYNQCAADPAAEAATGYPTKRTADE